VRCAGTYTSASDAEAGWTSHGCVLCGDGADDASFTSCGHTVDSPATGSASGIRGRDASHASPNGGCWSTDGAPSVGGVREELPGGVRVGSVHDDLARP